MQSNKLYGKYSLLHLYVGTRYAAMSKEQVYNYLPGFQRGIIQIVSVGPKFCQQPDSHCGMDRRSHLRKGLS